MANFYGSICLTDIPKELIKTASNGKKYLNIDIYERKEVGKFGATHTIKASCKREEQKDGVNYFIGGLKPSTQAQTQAQASEVHAHDDLPF